MISWRITPQRRQCDPPPPPPTRQSLQDKWFRFWICRSWPEYSDWTLEVRGPFDHTKSQLNAFIFDILAYVGGFTLIDLMPVFPCSFWVNQFHEFFRLLKTLTKSLWWHFTFFSVDSCYAHDYSCHKLYWGEHAMKNANRGIWKKRNSPLSCFT